MSAEAPRDLPLVGEGNPLDSLQEGREPSLGELNPLLHSPNLLRRETVEAIKLTIGRGIEKYHGLKPISADTVAVWVSAGKLEPYFVIRWEIPLLCEQQVESLEQVVREIYRPHRVVTRKGVSGDQKPPDIYPKIDITPQTAPAQRCIPNRIGWVMGPYTGKPDNSFEGLFVFREIGDKTIASSMRSERNPDWFTIASPVNFRGQPIKTRHFVEIRAVNLYQNDLVKFVLQVGRVLAGEKPLPGPRLTYEIYQMLNQLGLKKREREDIYGLGEAIDYIDNNLFFPLRNLRETLRRRVEVSSVLLIGAPGTGKTLLSEYFLQQQDLGVFLVPIPIDSLVADLLGKKEIVNRIISISQETDIPVVLQVDDIDSLGNDPKGANTALMNLMAGVRRSGFFILASTNNPYDLSYQLLQPERFGHILHIPLLDEEARLGILKVHAPFSFFENPEEGKFILKAVASKTNHFDSRRLKALCDYAQICAMRRDSFGSKLTIDDFQEAYVMLSKSFQEKEVSEREQKLEEFANRHNAIRTGFRVSNPEDQTSLKTIFEGLKNLPASSPATAEAPTGTSSSRKS